MVHKADFERVLATRWAARSAHFALHHLDAAPLPRVWVARSVLSDPGCTELSTGPAPLCPQAVDDSPAGLWFACVVPKRHARRSVTRSLMKRQIRSAFDRFGSRLPSGLWLVRLRAPFPKTEFVSASSMALATAVRGELESLLARVR